jgi:hypothetical protein
MATYKTVGEAKSWPGYAICGCSKCGDKKSDLVMQRLVTDKYGNDVEEKSGFLCYHCCSNSPLWVEYFNSIRDSEIKKSQDLAANRKRALKLIANAENISIVEENDETIIYLG